MAVAPFTLELSADLSVPLNERLTRGGVVAANLTKGVPGTFWLLPRDNRRRYVAFSMITGVGSIILTPDNDNAPAGFVLNSNDAPLEFGGKILASLIESEWWVTTFAASDFHVVAIRD